MATTQQAAELAAEAAEPPSIGALVAVRGQRWVVSEVDPGDGAAATHTGADVPDASTLVTLQSVEDGRYGETLSVVWEVEPAARTLPSGSLPEPAPGGFDPPERLAAFLDAVRWSAVTSADVKTLQAPFRSGADIEDYQLEPVARAVDAPRVNLLLADDVGLGKTIEAGLVARELLLRHRAGRVLIVCPAGLTVKWRDEMAEKFGLEFTIVDSERCATVRRTHGSAANPFEVHPLAIVSLPWLRGAKAGRLLDEVLPADGPTYPRTFDLLILDEAHHVAPAAPKQLYAVDSQQTKLIRRLAPHFTHRLFLSATPHNGYQESFTALLEILDDQRFARGMPPDGPAVRDTVVRRLKRDIVDPDGSPRFPERHAVAMPVTYPDDEREIHGLLTDFARVRRERLQRSRRGRKAADLVTLLLKKRLFSSPAAFGRTVGVYLQTLRSAGRLSTEADADADEVPEWLQDFFDEVATVDDERLAQAEEDALDRARPLQPDPTDDEVALLERMERWAAAHEATPDAKARELIGYLRAVCRPDGDHWTNERVAVFTEYRDTLRWLARLLTQEGLGGDHVAQLHGDMPQDEREQLRLAFQADPVDHPVRILLATDAAGEGIDLQNHCHRLVNYDIPFNPNKLEQRIGRIDRYGQNETPEIRHFVGTGWERAVDSYEADLEFLSRVAGKVAQMEEDLGRVNAVLSDAVQRRMLGERVDLDADMGGVAATTEAAAGGRTGSAPGRRSPRDDVPRESNVTEQVRRLHTHLDQTVDELGITPARVKRVVDTALELAHQQPLRPYVDDPVIGDGWYEVPPLTQAWERASAGLLERLRREGQPPKQRPVTFDQNLARGVDDDDVVLAHLGHPLVAMSTDLLRAAVSNERVGLHRVAAVVSDDPALEDVLVGAYSRFVLVGGDGIRLHEEVLYAGGWAPAAGRFRRLENLGVLGGFLDRALTSGGEASPYVQGRLTERWPRVRDGLLAAIDWRARTRHESLDNKLAARREAEQRRITANLDQFAHTLRSALADDDADAEDALFSRVEAAKSQAELKQFRQDRRSWEERLAGLETVRERELEAVAARYRDPRPHLFPVAVVFVVPSWEASR